MQSTGQASTQAVSFTPMQGSAITYAIGRLLPQSYASRREDSSEAEVNAGIMAIMVEKISALTFRVSNMKVSVQFYRDVLGMELLYGGETAGFSSLRAKYPESAILNLEEGNTVTQWGRLIFYVADVDEVWRHLKERGFDPPQPQNASWGERYFNMPDADGHELSFARPLKEAFGPVIFISHLSFA